MSDDTSTAADPFSGDWLVTEHVYDPDGTYRGLVAQRRRVEPVGHGRIRVVQHCEPSPELDGHPMAAFAGDWIFELEVDGTRRRYLGPDVMGAATEWQPGTMTGRGIWPRFGYEFESYSVLVAPDRQLTGGFFSLAGRSVADIVGVAVPGVGRDRAPPRPVGTGPRGGRPLAAAPHGRTPAGGGRSALAAAPTAAVGHARPGRRLRLRASRGRQRVRPRRVGDRGLTLSG